jgi:hypothetical protein
VHVIRGVLAGAVTGGLCASLVVDVSVWTSVLCCEGGLDPARAGWETVLIGIALGAVISAVVCGAGLILALPIWLVLHLWGLHGPRTAAIFGAVASMIAAGILVAVAWPSVSDPTLKLVVLFGSMGPIGALTGLVVWRVAYADAIPSPGGRPGRPE